MSTKVSLFFCTLVFMFFSCAQKYRINYRLIEDFEKANHDCVDTKEIDFKTTIDSSKMFIHKFKLSDDENTMIGFWRDASWLVLPNTHTANKIGVYSFLPNKKYIKSSHYDGYDGSPIVIKYGDWRVVNKQVEIQNTIICTVIDKHIVNYEYVDNPKYEIIFAIEQYDKYPINSTPFKNEKVPRYRSFHDFINYGPKIYSPATGSGSILYNPEDTIEYIEKLLHLDYFYFY